MLQEPTRTELFRACYSNEGIAQNVEAARTIEQMDGLTSQLSGNRTDEPRPQDIYYKGVVPSRSVSRSDKLQWKSVERLSAEFTQYKAKESQRQWSSVNNSDGTNVPYTSPRSLMHGILRRLEAFVASSIGCGGSDVGIA
ncbi:hypothetical protein Tco_0886854 [Tanacetum coccineum]